MSIEFLITSLIIVASPGTGVVYTLAAGLSRGPRASIVAAFACTLGIVPHLTAAILGLAALLHASALAFEMVKYAGVAYLLYMAWRSLQEHGVLSVERREDRRSSMRIIVDGVVVNLLNPKLSIFFVSFLPQFIGPQEAHPLLAMLELSGVFMALTFVIFAVYGVFAGVMRDHVVSSPAVMTWMRRSFAAAFGLLAVKLATTER
ncbi:MAG: LysE family translocator [Ancalomicrobiaceae bacterium]|nr:LysE family translocator [Ancalomicrobiaceae bacterium]